MRIRDSVRETINRRARREADRICEGLPTGRSVITDSDLTADEKDYAYGLVGEYVAIRRFHDSGVEVEHVSGENPMALGDLRVPATGHIVEVKNSKSDWIYDLTTGHTCPLVWTAKGYADNGRASLEDYADVDAHILWFNRGSSDGLVIRAVSAIELATLDVDAPMGPSYRVPIDHWHSLSSFIEKLKSGQSVVTPVEINQNAVRERWPLPTLMVLGAAYVRASGISQAHLIMLYNTKDRRKVSVRTEEVIAQADILFPQWRDHTPPHGAWDHKDAANRGYHQVCYPPRFTESWTLKVPMDSKFHEVWHDMIEHGVGGGVAELFEDEDGS